MAEPKLSLFVGGHNYVSIQLYFFRINVLIDLVGAEATFFDYTFKADVVEYKKVCQSIGWEFKAVELNVTTSVDLNECSYGAAGIYFGDYYKCDWKNMTIEYPWFQTAAPKLRYNGTFMQETCYQTGINYQPPFLTPQDVQSSEH